MSKIKQLLEHSIVKGVLIGLLVMTAVFGVSIVWAQDNTIIYYACVNNSSGTIKMINDTEECKKHESRISHNTDL